MRLPNYLNSIKGRLIVPPVLVLAGSILFAVAMSLFNSNARIKAEIRSGTELGEMVIGYALNSLKTTDDAQATVTRLMSDLHHIRHVRFLYQPAETGRAAALGAAAEPEDAPPPLMRVFDWHPDRQVFPVLVNGRVLGQIVMVGFAGDEITEILQELLFLVTLLASTSLLIMAVILLAGRAALRPIALLTHGLEQMSRGQYRMLPVFGVTELDPIRRGFNHLARSLDDAQADNRRLIDRLMSVQETERQEIARELHDDFGAILFGARAELSLLTARAKTLGPGRQAVLDHAQAVSAMIDEIQQQNIHILERLRPMALAHMDAASAIRDFVMEWETRRPQIGVTLDIAPDLAIADSELALTLYRAVQECLTNIDRHAAASEVLITLRPDDTDGTTTYLVVEDDGAGLRPNHRRGFGLLGMAERARRLGGDAIAANRPEGGVSVTVTCRSRALTIGAASLESV